MGEPGRSRRSERPRAQNPPPPLGRHWTKPRLGLRYLRLPSARRTLGADAQFSDILPNSMTASWSCGGPRLPVELIRPSAGGSCIQAPRCPASASPPGVKGKRASGRAALVGARCRLRDCMRLGIGRGTGVCSLRPVVAPGPSLRSSEVQFGRPLSPFTSGGPDGAHYILFGCKTWRSENP